MPALCLFSIILPPYNKPSTRITFDSRIGNNSTENPFILIIFGLNVEYLFLRVLFFFYLYFLTVTICYIIDRKIYLHNIYVKYFSKTF